MNKGDLYTAAILCAIPALGAASAIAIEKGATKYGHTFMQFGPKNVFLVGLIGAVQSIASLYFTLLLEAKFGNGGDEKISAVHYLVGHALSAFILVGLTALAAKVNLITASITLFGAAAVLAASLISNAPLIYLASTIEDS